MLGRATKHLVASMQFLVHSVIDINKLQATTMMSQIPSWQIGPYRFGSQKQFSLSWYFCDINTLSKISLSLWSKSSILEYFQVAGSNKLSNDAAGNSLDWVTTQWSETLLELEALSVRSELALILCDTIWSCVSVLQANVGDKMMTNKVVISIASAVVKRKRANVSNFPSKQTFEFDPLNAENYNWASSRERQEVSEKR